MHILVTGGAGFIGSVIVPLFQQSGHHISVIDNLSFGNRALLDIPDEDFYVEDIRDWESVKRVIRKTQPDVVIHLAAVHFIPYCNAHPYESADINIRGTLNVLDALKETSSVQKVFFASTAAVYAISDEAVTESHTLQPLDMYGLSKFTGERLCREFQLETGVDTIICRFFNAFGPNETNPHLIPEIERQLREGQRTIQLGNLTPKRDFIHTYDMANAIKSLLELSEVGYDAFNIGRGIEYAVTEVVDAFAHQLNEKVKIKVDPARVRKTERMHLLADVSKLKAATGWEPAWSLDRGIKDLIENWKAPVS